VIKINLLPGKKKKKAGIRKEIILFILPILLLLVLILLVQWKMGKEKNEILTQMSNTEKEIMYYKSLTKEIEKAKESQKTLQEKLNVINTLRKEKGSPAKILDELSIVKPDKIQLESLKKEGSKLGIEGIALDDETVANFMTNLRKSKMFKNVDLIVSEQIELSKNKLKKFILACDIALM
jgi:type IV pilus assembly protein PilN